MSTQTSAVNELALASALESCDPLLDLVHDIRQPLSSMEHVAALLELQLPPHMTEARRQVSRMQSLVLAAEACLHQAVQANRQRAKAIA